MSTMKLSVIDDQVPDTMDHEVCDSCRQRAYVLVAVRVGQGLRPLSFCRHHFARAEKALAMIEAQVRTDIRAGLELHETRSRTGA